MGVYDREKLYEEVWNEPVTIVAKRYGVSDVMLKKVCDKLNVPTPGKGYWQKIKFGAKIDKVRLPKDKGEFVEHRGHAKGYESFMQRKETIKLTSIKEQHYCKIKVSEQLRDPHPLVDQAYKKLKSLWDSRTLWSKQEKDPVRHLDDDFIDIRVSKSSTHRALCIMDAVIKALIDEGYSVKCGIKWRKHTHVTIKGEDIGFRLHEHIRQVPHVKTEEEIRDEKKWKYSNTPTYDHIPTGNLALTIEYYQYLPQKTWKDTEKHRLEDCLNEFIGGLKMAAVQSKIETEKRLEEECKRQEEEEKRRLEAERRAKEIKKFEMLEKDASDWQRSQIIKNYVDALEASLCATLTEEELSKRREYIEWARGKIDWINPLVVKEDEILGSRNKKL